MYPIILFFEDHRDPITKELLSKHLEDLQALQVNTLGLEIDKDTSIDKHLSDLFKCIKLWSTMDALSRTEKERMLASVSNERRVEFQHHISYLPSRRAEANLILSAKRMGQSLEMRGFDLNLGLIRELPPQELMLAAYSTQIEREQAMVENLAALNTQSGIAAILGLSHFEVANRLKEQGHEVFCFLSLSAIYDDTNACSKFLTKIEQKDEAVSDLVLLDARKDSIDDMWQIIESTIRMRSEIRIVR